jgi:hypothetical protein
LGGCTGLLQKFFARRTGGRWLSARARAQQAADEFRQHAHSGSST